MLAGGKCDDSEGYFVRPTVVECADPTDELFTREYFGPILGVHVYDDTAPGGWHDTLVPARGGLAVRADRRGVRPRPGGRRRGASRRCGSRPGNFYVNDKPTGAVVGQQPFGGGRASGHERQGRLGRGT